jgi:dihydroorotate dehydrogenase (fumarate)
MSSYSSSLAGLVSRLHWTGKVAGFVLFNRYFRPDIDIERMELTSAGVFSNPSEITIPLRWVALLSGIVESDFASSTGVHDSDGVVKMLLAGAQAVQVVSAFYQQSPEVAGDMISGLTSWMERHSFTNLDEFRGKLAYQLGDDQSAFERVQFMKHYAGIS